MSGCDSNLPKNERQEDLTVTDDTQKCTARTEVYARVCGFFRPVQQWNKGKKEEYRDRKTYVVPPVCGGNDK